MRRGRPRDEPTNERTATVKAYKGFDKDMKCRDFQYKEGGEYETDRAEVCESGFHGCENPLDCFAYYHPSDGSVFHEVELDGDIKRGGEDTKCAATKIKIGARLTLAGMVKAGLDFVFAKVEKLNPPAATSGDRSTAATSGYRSTAEVSGKESVAVVTGLDCKARGCVGSWLVLTERDNNWHILGIKAICIDGKKYRADTWYTLKGGRVVRAEP